MSKQPDLADIEASISFPLTERAEPLRLDIGAGDHRIDGYVSVDVKTGGSAYPLRLGVGRRSEIDDESVDVIRASHVLEHFPHGQVRDVLRHWFAKLRPGGVMRLAVPDFAYIAAHYLAQSAVNVQGYAMGGQTDEYDYHKAIFDAQTLREMLVDVGLQRIMPWTSELAGTDREDCACLPVSLNLEGHKPTLPLNRADGCRAVLSCPRYAPTAHYQFSQQAFALAGVPCNKTTGAYWHQILCEEIEAAIARGATYIFTCDYDSIFRTADVLELYRLMEAVPDADAIVAVQTKRGRGRTSLLGMDDAEGNPRTNVPACEFDCNLTRIHRAHFGLTIFRAARLAELPRPWMVGVPNSDGRWGDGKLDPDIEFWRNWHAAGRNLWLANRVRIGHLEERIAFPGPDFQPVYIGVQDYADNGPPPECSALHRSG